MQERLASKTLVRSDIVPVALLFATSLAVYVGTAARIAQSAATPLTSLGVFFDSHIYVEIARSFPFPYAAEAIDYTALFPGYPFAI